jgi:hypothetical protein
MLVRVDRRRFSKRVRANPVDNVLEVVGSCVELPERQRDVPQDVGGHDPVQLELLRDRLLGVGARGFQSAEE